MRIMYNIGPMVIFFLDTKTYVCETPSLERLIRNMSHITQYYQKYRFAFLFQLGFFLFLLMATIGNFQSTLGTQLASYTHISIFYHILHIQNMTLILCTVDGVIELGGIQKKKQILVIILENRRANCLFGWTGRSYTPSKLIYQCFFFHFC